MRKVIEEHKGYMWRRIILLILYFVPLFRGNDMSWVLSSQFRGGIETKRAAINGLPLKTSGLLNKIDREQLYQAFSKLHTLCQV